NKKCVITFIDDASMFCYVYLLHAKDEALDKFRIYKTEVELQQNDLIKTLHMDRGGEYYDPVFFQSVRIIHETTAPYTPQQNDVAERKNKALKEMVNSMLSYSGLKSRDAIFYENRFSSIPRPKDIILNVHESQMDDHTDDVPNEILEPRKSKRVRKAKSYGYDFQLYLVEGSRDQVGSKYSYCYSIEEDPRTYNEVMQSRHAAFWKESIDDEIGSIMKNNTWVLSNLPPGCKPLGCKWIFKRKMKVDGTIDKFKSRLFNREDCSLISTPMDPVEKLKPNTWKPIDQLEYSRAIGCLMYAMTSTRPDIAYDVGILSRFTSNPSRQHWKAITRVFKYWRGVHAWGGAISWAFKKQTCITGSTMESEFVALAAAVMAIFHLSKAQDFAPSPSPLPSNDGAAIDQGIAYILLLVALAITYLVH
nr:retrotransposon protein, putative, Ty1-copia subclass [Tanacetum cinerariifolium]